MSLTRQAKEQAVADLVEKLGRAKGGIVADFTGLNVAKVNAIRQKFRDINAEYKVVKNTLMKRALTGTPIEALGDHFRGPTAVAFKYDDELSVLGKTAKEINKEFEAFKVKAVYIDVDVRGEDGLEMMANLPTLIDVQAEIISLLQRPAQDLKAILDEPGEKLWATINAPGEELVGLLERHSQGT
jgi:large subunit ribosomal protein L10